MEITVPRLVGNCTHVWIGLAPAVRTAGAGTGWLSAAETARADSYRFAKDRNRFILARTMLRSLLGGYLELDPVSIEFAPGEFGKPHAPAARSGGIEFNCSRSGDLVLCAVCRGCEVGVDVEFVRTDLDFRSLASAAFSAADIETMPAEGTARRAKWFFDLWTRKEAAAKLSGKGLNADVRTVDKSEVALVGLDVPDGYIAHLATSRPMDEVRLLRWNGHR